MFPMIRRYVGVADYRRLQRRFRGNLSLHAIAFTCRGAAHATEDEQAALLGDAGRPLRCCCGSSGAVRRTAEVVFG